MDERLNAMFESEMNIIENIEMLCEDIIPENVYFEEGEDEIDDVAIELEDNTYTYLFYGDYEDNIERIAREGFSIRKNLKSIYQEYDCIRRFSGKNEVYLSSLISTSLLECLPHSKPTTKILLCKVNLGRNLRMRCRDCNINLDCDIFDGFDSITVVNSERITIVFDETKIKPIVIVTIQK